MRDAAFSGARVRTDDRPAGAWFVPPDGQYVPDIVRPAPTPVPVTGARKWLRIAARRVTDIVVAFAVLMFIPLFTIGISNGVVWRRMEQMPGGNTRARVARSAPMRAFASPKDPAITPLQAGLALEALQPPRTAAGFRYNRVPSRPEAPWRNPETLRSPFSEELAHPSYNGPSAKVLDVAPRGFTKAEMAYLERVATAPVWREFDRVAQAPAVDLIGGQFVAPFSSDVSAWQVPVIRFAATKEMAHASAARAAYHLARGQPDAAEAALRSVVSFGFALIDNGTFLIDQLIGVVIVEIGRDQLAHLYAVTGNPAGKLLPANLITQTAVSGAASAPRIPAAVTAFDPMPDESVAEIRARLIGRAAAPQVSRATRFETLMELSLAPCTNVRELLFGPKVDVRNAFDRARRELARYPSEAALIDLIQRSAPPQADQYRRLDWVSQFLYGTATLAGTALNNPRIATCTRAILP